VEIRVNFPSDDKTAVGVIVEGELDQTTLQHDYWSSLSKKDQQAIVNNGALEFNLAKVERGDTAGLAWLINIVKDARADKVEVSFKSVPDKLLNLAELSSAKQILM